VHDFLNDFRDDREFCALLARGEDVNLPVAALELARDARPGLDFAPVLDWIDSRAAELAGALALARTDHEMLSRFGECLAGRYGIAGSKAAYESDAGSFLDQVIERKTGLPISLSVLYMAVADSAGVPLRGVGAPARFLTRYETLDEPLFVDPFAGGQVLSLDDCVARIAEAAGVSSEQALPALDAVGPRVIVTRMLNNLKALYARLGEWKKCFRVQHRLLALAPSAYAERRDWGLVALKAERAGPALEMLEQAVGVCPDDERELIKRHIDLARGQLARWN
jgi:regulator of sirC expression with transglutaminase-like and TPR domain